MASRVHMGLEFLSTHANIYESTHAHYDGKTKFVYRTKPKSYFCWSAFFVSSWALKHNVKETYAKLTRVCGVEQILPTFTCIREINNCHINPRVYISHPHSTNYNDHSVLNWIQLTDHELLTVFTQKYTLFTQCCSGSCSSITQSFSELAAKGLANHSWWLWV